MKLVPLGKHGKNGQFDAKDFLVAMMETCPTGQTIGQMRPRLAVLDKIRKANGKVLLEDAEHRILLDVINGRNDFVVTSSEIIAVVDAIERAEEHKPE